jgi:hypothetical protein
VAKRRSIRIDCTILGSRENPYTVLKKSMRKEGIDAAREVLWDEAKFLAEKLRLNLLQQSLPSVTNRPLNEKYANWKANQDPPLDPRILIATGEYVNSIDARKVDIFGDVVEVNVPDETHESSGMNLRELAAVHEYGQRSFKDSGKGIPPRPHWRPTIRWWKKRRLEATQREIDRIVGERVFKKLKARLGSYEMTIKPRK